MLARVKWAGNRTAKNGLPIVEYGTLLAVVYAAHEMQGIVACDGFDEHTRGKIIPKPIGVLRVITRFNWDGPPRDDTATIPPR